jgi:CubicO group peptidase (beta-lactamase class C family)
MTCAQFFKLLIAFLSLTFVQPALARAPISAKTEAVDKFFAKWNSPNAPGGVVAILSNGKTIYSHAYGLANLDYNIRNEPSTSFAIASMSKQFTAFSIYLLAQDR